MSVFVDGHREILVACVTLRTLLCRSWNQDQPGSPGTRPGRTFGRTSRREETIDANANFSDSDAPLGKTNQDDSLGICGGSPCLLILWASAKPCFHRVRQPSWWRCFCQFTQKR